MCVLQGLQYVQSFHGQLEEKREKKIMGWVQGLQFVQSFQGLQYAQSFHGRLEPKRNKEIMNCLQGLQYTQNFQGGSEEKRNLQRLQKAQSFHSLLEEKKKREIMVGFEYTLSFHGASEEKRKKEIMSSLQVSEHALSFHSPSEEKRNKEMCGLQGLQFVQNFHGRSKKWKEEIMGSLPNSRYALNFHGLSMKKEIIGGLRRLRYAQSFHSRSEEKRKKERTGSLQGLQYALSFQGRFSSPTIYPAIDAHPEREALEIHLCAELQRLQEFGNYLSAAWLRQALDVCLSMHREVEELFPQIGQVILRQNSKWMDETLDDTVKLLDVCNALSNKMRDMKQCQEKLHLVLHCFNGPIGAGQLVRARTALSNFNESSAKTQNTSRLENCSSMLRRMAEKRVAQSEGADLGQPFHAAKDLTVFVCGLLIAALSTKSRRSLPLPCAGNSAWACAFQTLYFKVKKELERRRNKGNGRVLLDEMHAVDSSSRAVYDLLVNSKSVPLNKEQDSELRQSVVCLKNCIAELEDGMAPLESQINELFRVVVAGRMALLDALTFS